MPLPRWLRPTLIVLALAFAVSGAAGILAGLLAAPWLRSLLPDMEADAGVVGGAAVAVGAGLAVVGVVHAAIAAVLERRSRVVRATVVIAGLTLAMVTVVGIATVGVTLAAVPSATALWAALPALGLALFVYASLAFSMLRIERR